MIISEKLTKDEVEKLLLPFYPEKLLPKYVLTPQEIASNKSILKQIPCSDFSLSYIADIILWAVNNKKRFRQEDCLKVLRSISKNNLPNQRLNQNTISKLFQIYQHFIFSQNENIQWYVSVLIKDRELTNQNIHWLIENHTKSNHIVNRLLSYPTTHVEIVKWAELIYIKKQIPNRQSQILALLIQQDLPDIVVDKYSNEILWAIYFSKMPKKEKENLLIKYTTSTTIKTTLDIGLKISSPKVIEHIAAKI